MKLPHWLSNITNPPRLFKIDVGFTLLPAVLWAILVVYVHPSVVDPKCGERIGACTHKNISKIDRSAVHFKSEKANRLSNITQNTMGILAFSLPATLHLTRVALKTVVLRAGLVGIAVDTVILLQATLWNGTINSAVRSIVQRPRPFVFRDHALGKSPSNYTSFYSGHTSFAALAAMFLILCLMARKAPGWLVIGGGGVGLVLTFTTALMRILAGKHFLTDVVFATIFGALISLWIFRMHQKHPKT